MKYNCPRSYPTLFSRGSCRNKRPRLLVCQLGIEALEERRLLTEYVQGELLLSFREGIDRAAMSGFMAGHGLRELENLGRNLGDAPGRIKRVSVPQQLTTALIPILQHNPLVELVEPNYIYRTQEVIPNDPSFGELWGLHNTGQSGGTLDADIDAPLAWEITTGSAVGPNAPVVFVIDSGVDYNHPDLAANIWKNPGECLGAGGTCVADGLDNDGNGYIDDFHGINAITGSGNPMDDNNHGTHVAGTIGAVGSNGVGVVGVNWNVQIGACKFLGSGGSGSTTDAIECFNYVNDLRSRGVNVVITNNSWGGGGFSQTLMNAMAGPILHAAAAGNTSNNNDAIAHYPSSYNLDNIIAVAATDRFDQYASFSNYGATSVDLAAPGVSILSTTPGGNYATFSGTSMATPHVAGAAALAYAAFPTQTAIAIKQALMDSADDIAGIGTNAAKPTLTQGRLNIHRTLVNLGETDTTPPAAVTSLSVDQAGLASAMLTWIATGDDGLVGTAQSYDVRYSTSPISEANWAAATQAVGEPHPQPAGLSESFRVDGLQRGTTYHFGVKVKDNKGNTSALSNVVSATTALGTLIFSDGFESGLTQWTAQSPWGRTTSLKQSGNYSATDSPSGNYANNANTSLTSRTIDLSGYDEVQLSFWQRYRLESSYDFGYLEVSGNGGSTWTALGSYTGTNTTFHKIASDLSAYAGNPSVRIRFRLQSDFTIRYDGWYIDDVEIAGRAGPINQPPTAHSQSAATSEDTPASITLTGSDVENDPLTFVIVTPPGQGTLSGVAPNLTYTPHLNFNGPDSFTFKANDGTSDSNVATVSIEVSPENDPPVADDQSIEVTQNVSKSITLTGSDPDGDLLTFEVLSYPTWGTLSGTAPNLSYAPNLNYNGQDSFTFRVNDGTTPSVPATVSITVSPTGPSPAVVLYFSLESGGNIGGLTVADEDIVAFDGIGFSLYFDGSDVGVGSLMLGAFAILSSTEILLSFTTPGTVPGISGTVDDSDIVMFSATSLGEFTAGTFAMYFDGSDVELAANSEGIDALEWLDNGSLLISTTGSFNAGGISGDDEDLIQFIPTSLGPSTAGTLSLYFDGSDVGLSNNSEDIDAIAVSAEGVLYISTTGNFSVTGISGADEDVFVFTPTSLGSSTTGSFSPSLFFDGSAYGLSGNDLNAIDLPRTSSAASRGARLAAEGAVESKPLESKSSETVKTDPVRRHLAAELRFFTSGNSSKLSSGRGPNVTLEIEAARENVWAARAVERYPTAKARILSRERSMYELTDGQPQQWIAAVDEVFDGALDGVLSVPLHAPRGTAAVGAQVGRSR